MVVTKLDRLARPLTDARNIVEELTEAGVKLNIGGSLHDPTARQAAQTQARPGSASGRVVAGRQAHERRAGRAVLRRPLHGLTAVQRAGEPTDGAPIGARVSAQAFVDESGRGSRHHVAVTVVANGDVDELWRLVRSFCLRGQRRWHSVHERDSRRSQIIDAIVAERP